jgi:hypothetical protein
MGSVISDYNKRLIQLSVILLSGGHYICKYKIQTLTFTHPLSTSFTLINTHTHSFSLSLSLHLSHVHTHTLSPFFTLTHTFHVSAKTIEYDAAEFSLKVMKMISVFANIFFEMRNLPLWSFSGTFSISYFQQQESTKVLLFLSAGIFGCNLLLALFFVETII